MSIFYFHVLFLSFFKWKEKVYLLLGRAITKSRYQVRPRTPHAHMKSFQSNVNRFSRMSSYHNNRKIYFRHSYLASGRPFFLYAFWNFSIIRLPFPKFCIHCTCISKGTYYLHDIKRSELYRMEIQQLLGRTKRGPCPQAPVSSKCWVL